MIFTVCNGFMRIIPTVRLELFISVQIMHCTIVNTRLQPKLCILLPAEGQIHLQAPVRLAWLPETMVLGPHVFRPPLPPSRNMLNHKFLNSTQKLCFQQSGTCVFIRLTDNNFDTYQLVLQKILLAMTIPVFAQKLKLPSP